MEQKYGYNRDCAQSIDVWAIIGTGSYGNLWRMHLPE